MAPKSANRYRIPYWVAYCRSQGRMRKVYLGQAHTLTQDRLETIAQAFRVAHAGPLSMARRQEVSHIARVKSLFVCVRQVEVH